MSVLGSWVVACPEGSWLAGEFAEFFPRHYWSQGSLAHGFNACASGHTFGTSQLLQPDKQETPFRLLLYVKDIPRAPVLQDNPLFGINDGYAH
jgi:hypothetical protein